MAHGDNIFSEGKALISYKLLSEAPQMPLLQIRANRAGAALQCDYILKRGRQHHA